ncbi:MAG TPA: hypothetical protein VMZ30_08740 [Pyrinomonadaceae bacterium]|nr:hypothetical protein [Pyrinomonadaceae bacterium]
MKAESIQRGWEINDSNQPFPEGDHVPDEQRTANNSQTYCVDADEFTYETLEQANGQATVVRFQLNDPQYHAGDVVVVLSGSEIHFHGMIGRLADGWATATDRRASLLPATVQ